MMTITGTLRGQHFIIKKKGQLVLNILTRVTDFHIQSFCPQCILVNYKFHFELAF